MDLWNADEATTLFPMSLLHLEIAETIGVLVVAVASSFLGWWFMLRFHGKSWWWVGYAVPLAVILCIDIPRWIDAAAVQRMFKWFVAGRVEFVLMAFAIPMLLVVCIHKLKKRGEKIAVSLFGVIATVNFSILPFLLPALMYSELSAIATKFDAHGVCLQSTGYNCGPAAAVTVLRKLGIEAEESTIAIHARTTKVAGTQEDLLSSAITDRYGVPCRAVYLDNLEELRGEVPFVALIEFSLFVDHYIAVLEVNEDSLIVGDPLYGRTKMSKEDFVKRWRKSCLLFGTGAVAYFE